MKELLIRRGLSERGGCYCLRTGGYEVWWFMDLSNWVAEVFFLCLLNLIKYSVYTIKVMTT